MGDQTANFTPVGDGLTNPISEKSRAEQHPFHAQLDNLAQARGQQTQQTDGSEPQAFDMHQMATALPTASDQSPYTNRRPSSNYIMPANSMGMMGPASFQYAQQMPQYGQQRHYQQHSQQQYLPQHFVPQPAQYQMGNRSQQVPQMQPQPHYTRIDPYAYGTNQPAYSPVDMRFPQQQYPMGYSAPNGYADMGEMTYGLPLRGDANRQPPAQFARRTSEPTAIPSLPRGPPRKPKQSGHALWVGNLPPAATVTDLKDHFSRDATTDIQSLFLISKSNCAFVNYRSESACVAAMNRFHDSKFHGVRLVCRLRRGSTSTAAQSPKSATESNTASKESGDSAVSNEPSDPIIVGSVPATLPDATNKAAAPNPATNKVPEKFFVVKSLTLQDLEASVRNGIWATQSHNESTLNQAFNAADNVYLIFSANKSGEYFGYARMVSSITGEAVSIGSTPTPQRPVSSDGPKSISTPATQTAPRGRIIDDSARGTVFWEAELSDEEDSGSPNKEMEDGNNGQDLGRPFKIEWVSTARLPFYRTRGLRNPWNANREVKIARDGTELEPSIGKRLVQMFHRPAQMEAPPQAMQAGGMPYPMT